jgi:hypothetical protein
MTELPHSRGGLLMERKTITAQDFLMGRAVTAYRGVGRHPYRARWIQGKGIVVLDDCDQEVRATFAATEDNRTVTAHVEGVGYIGGWQYPHKAQSFKALVSSINRGRLYYRQSQLPTKGMEATV